MEADAKATNLSKTARSRMAARVAKDSGALFSNTDISASLKPPCTAASFPSVEASFKRSGRDFLHEDGKRAHPQTRQP